MSAKQRNNETSKTRTRRKQLIDVSQLSVSVMAYLLLDRASERGQSPQQSTYLLTYLPVTGDHYGSLLRVRRFWRSGDSTSKRVLDVLEFFSFETVEDYSTVSCSSQV